MLGFSLRSFRKLFWLYLNPFRNTFSCVKSLSFPWIFWNSKRSVLLFLRIDFRSVNVSFIFVGGIFQDRSSELNVIPKTVPVVGFFEGFLKIFACWCQRKVYRFCYFVEGVCENFCIF